MKKLKILITTIVVAGVMATAPQNVFATVDTYIVKDATSGKLYQYDVKDMMSNLNSRLFFEFTSNSKKNGIYMVHDDETGKYINYENVKIAVEDKNNGFDLKELCKTAQGEKAPFYVYNKVVKNDQIQNEVNFTGNDVEIDFAVLQLKEPGNVHISGNNSKLSNLEFKENLILTPKKNGEITLKNIQAKNIKIAAGEANRINLIDVKAEELEIESNVKVHLAGNTVIKNSMVKEGTEIQTEGLATIEKIRIDTKNPEVQVKLDGNFGEVQVDKVCNLELSAASKIGKLNAVSDVILKGDSVARIGIVEGVKNIKNENGSVGSSKEEGAIKDTAALVDQKEDKKPDATTSASKHHENKPTTGGTTTGEENKPTTGGTTKPSTGGGINPSTGGNVVVNPPTGEVVVVKPQPKFQVVDEEKSCIVNIHYVNYGVMVLQQGNYLDYNFYLEGVKTEVQPVNKEGTVVKIELKDRNAKKIVVEKGNEKEEITLKYKEAQF